MMYLIFGFRQRLLAASKIKFSQRQLIVARARAALWIFGKSYPLPTRLKLYCALEMAILATLPRRRLLLSSAVAACVIPLMLAVSFRLATSEAVTFISPKVLPSILEMDDAGLFAWTGYKRNFLDESGRIVDTGNANISHSEGQGYAMVLAVAAGDRPTFDRIWSWTQQNLMVRSDSLLSWRWVPASKPPVTDTNNASDGDILVAWALAEAGARWKNHAYTRASRNLALTIGKKLVAKIDGWHVIVPGEFGYSARERPDGLVVNL